MHIDATGNSAGRTGVVGAGVMCELKVCVPEFAAGDCLSVKAAEAGVCFVEHNECKWLTENRRNWFPFKPALTVLLGYVLDRSQNAG